MIMFSRDLSTSILANHRRWDLPLDLLRAIVYVESAGDCNAYRYEPHYKWLYNVREDLPVVIKPEDAPGPPGFGGPGVINKWTEFIGQKTSWGPMQVLGAVAREYKFRGYFPKLCHPNLGVHYGCKHLYVMKQRWRIKWNTPKGEIALATAYNTGSPKDEDHPYWRKIAEAMQKDADYQDG